MLTSRHDEWSYCDKGAQETIQICGKTGFSFISFTAHGTNSNKAILFFSLPSTAFSTTDFFLAALMVAMEKHLLQAKKQQKTCLRKH